MRKTIAFAASVALSAALAVPAAAAPKKADPLEGASLTAADTVGARQSGYTGQGVGVAILDTGVSPHQATLGDRIAASVDVSGTGRNTDGLGHGTFLAGLVVGQEGPNGERLGVAPDAHVVSVKVADAAGSTSLDRILTGLAAVKAAPAELNIRVIVLAIGGPSDDVADPIEEALEQMWHDGYFVVVASGNTGEYLTEPGTSPYLFTVGAVDDNGTPDDPADDSVPTWSGAGVGRDGNLKPDVLAPGKSVVSSRMAGSVADRENPGSRIAGRWFRGSGTSQAAAVAAGAAAVLLEANPGLGPDDVKGRLVESARPVDGSHAGVIDVLGALESTAVANGHLEPLSYEAPDAPVDEWQGLNWAGKNRWHGLNWAGLNWAGLNWAGDLWVRDEWKGLNWAGSHWIGLNWAQFDWQGSHWVGLNWANEEWAAKSWAGVSWENEQWVGLNWAGLNWAGSHWIGLNWANGGWAAGSWLGAHWLGWTWA